MQCSRLQESLQETRNKKLHSSQQPGISSRRGAPPARYRTAAPTIAIPNSIASHTAILGGSFLLEGTTKNGVMMIGGRISSDAAVLSELHSFYPWIPGEEQIRPTESTRAAKKQCLEGKTLRQVEEEIISAHTLTRNKSALVPCPFPYATDGAHYILWVMGDELPSEDYLTDCIRRHAIALGVREFVWYENPKMSVVSSHLHHVHVFAPAS